MKGLLTKDFLTIKKKYGLPRVIMDIAIIIALMFILEKSGTIYISFLLIPIEIMSMIISLTTCDEQWKWGKYAGSLPHFGDLTSRGRNCPPSLHTRAHRYNSNSPRS